MNDPLGKALLDFQKNGDNSDIIVHADILDDDVIPVPWFFRDYEHMPELDKTALQHCRGKILDAGAGAGSHALWLQDHNFETHAIDTSTGAVECMKNRGVNSADCQDFFCLKDQKFDTLLFLMNGVGICGTLNRLDIFFSKCSELLNEGGQILLDSSDIHYLFENDDGSFWMDTSKSYYGELIYQFEYMGKFGNPFEWLFIDYEKLSSTTHNHGFSCERLFEDDHFGYLARVSM